MKLKYKMIKLLKTCSENKIVKSLRTKKSTCYRRKQIKDDSRILHENNASKKKIQ